MVNIIYHWFSCTGVYLFILIVCKEINISWGFHGKSRKDVRTDSVQAFHFSHWYAAGDEPADKSYVS